jgi:hypothetical protein
MNRLGLAIVLLICQGVAAISQQPPDDSSRQSARQSADREQREEEPKPPSISYGDSRTSSKWIDVGGVSVAVDQGVEWKNVKVYLSLTWELVAVDAEKDELLWSRSVSAFWNGIGFKEVDTTDGKKSWAVELRPHPRQRDGKDLTAWFDLKTGEPIEQPAVDEKLGEKLEEAEGWAGGWSNIPRPFRIVVSTPGNWNALRKRMFDEQTREPLPGVTDVDFENQVLLIINGGDSSNCNGYSPAELYESEERLLLRLSAHTFQTIGEAKKTRPWGIVVLPRVDKPCQVQTNRQRLIAGPPLWRDAFEVERPDDPDMELDTLPRDE